MKNFQAKTYFSDNYVNNDDDFLFFSSNVAVIFIQM